MWEKRWKETALFGLTMACAGGTALAVFPAMIYHVFFSYRGKEAIDNLSGSGSWLTGLKDYYGILDRQMFGTMLSVLLILLLSAFFLRYVADRSGKASDWMGERIRYGFDRTDIERYLLLLVPCGCYFLVVSLSAFVQNDRYIVPIYAVLWGGILSLSLRVLRYFVQKKAYVFVAALFFALLFLRGWEQRDFTYLYRSMDSFLEQAKEYGDYDCICVMEGEPYLLYYDFAEYSNYKSITLITMEDLLTNDLGEYARPEGVVLSFVWVDPAVAEKYATEVCTANNYSVCELLGGASFETTYFVGN